MLISSPSGENLTTLTVLECRFSVERNSTVATFLSFTAEEQDFGSFISHSCNITISTFTKIQSIYNQGSKKPF